MGNSDARVKDTLHFNLSRLNGVEYRVNRAITDAVHHEVELFLMKRQ